MNALPESTHRFLPLPLPPGEARGEGAPARPRGFTIVELLVVAGLIAVLAALITPAAIRARAAARNAAIKAEIDMLHMAMMTYRNEYDGLPPCVSPTTSGSAMGRHLQRIFPGCDPVTEAAGIGEINLRNALVSWLGGYTDDPVNPVTGAGGRKRLYDFEKARIDATGAYTPVGLKNSPYLYIDSSRYASLQYSGTTPAQLAVAGAHCVPVSPRPSKPNSSTPDAWFFTNTSGGTPRFHNPDTFQILCAGLNGVFGDEDDLSNFWPGTRGQHLAAQQ